MYGPASGLELYLFMAKILIQTGGPQLACVIRAVLWFHCTFARRSSEIPLSIGFTAVFRVLGAPPSCPSVSLDTFSSARCTRGAILFCAMFSTSLAVMYVSGLVCVCVCNVRSGSEK